MPEESLALYTAAMGGYAKQRAIEKIARLSGEGLDLVAFWTAASEALTPVIPHYLSPCWYTLDPASLLITSHYQTELPELSREWFAHEYYEDDFHKLADVARSKSGMSTIHEVTNGDPSRSPAWNRYVRAYGGEQELLVALRTRAGVVWGMLAIYREPEQPQFDAEERRLLGEAAPLLAEGARRALLIGEALDPEWPEAPALVVLQDDWSVDSLTPEAERWLAELPDGNWQQHGTLPSAVLSVAGRALRNAEVRQASRDTAVARVRSREGRWAVLHGVALNSGSGRRVAVIIEPAQPARISPLLMKAYSLTEREQDVTRLVLQGDSTTEIAERLVVTENTVQQHLKSVFEKTGVRSRRDLVGKVFFAHYEPRVRDNERRASSGQPLRGGPLNRQLKI